MSIRLILISLLIPSLLLAQAEKKPADAPSKPVLPEIKAAQDKYDTAAAAAAEVYIGKQITAKKAYVASMELALKGALRAKKIAEAELINAAKDAAKQEAFKLVAARGKGVLLEFEVGVKAKPTHLTAKSALKRHDTLVTSARKIYVRSATTAKKLQIKQLDVALGKAANGGDLAKSKMLNAALEIQKSRLASLGSTTTASKSNSAKQKIRKVEISGTSRGVKIGTLKPSQSIAVKYHSGKWTASKTRSSVEPEKSPRPHERAVVLMYDKNMKLLEKHIITESSRWATFKAAPAGRSGKPSKSDITVVFAMNEGNPAGFADNAGRVTYLYKIIDAASGAAAP